jgi:hypothetical protein
VESFADAVLTSVAKSDATNFDTPYDGSDRSDNAVTSRSLSPREVPV